MPMWQLDEVVHVIIDGFLVGTFLKKRSLNGIYGRILEDCAVGGPRLDIFHDLEDK